MRVKGGPKGARNRNRITKQTEGFQGRLKNTLRAARRALFRSWQFSFRDRKQLKRDMRGLWIARITAASRARGLSYSKFMGALKKSEIQINRKMLADLAATNPAVFDKVVQESGISK